MYETKFHSEDLSGKSFLITGGAGFIGSNIVEYLLKHHAGKVRVLDNLITGSRDNVEDFKEYPAFDFFEGDIRDLMICREAVQDIDYVLHQAALGSVPRSLKEPEVTNSINVDGFVNMLIASKDEKVKRFVYASSSSVYGDSRDLPQLEERIGKPLSPYAVSKYVNELYAKVFADNYGLEVIGLRYFNVFGPRQSPKGAYAAVIPLFIHGLMHAQEVFINGDGTQTRDFTFVENAVQANILAAFTQNKKAINQVFNVAVGDSYSVSQMHRMLREYTGIKAEPSHRESRQGEIMNSLADISKAKTLLGYEPQIRFKDGLKKTVEYFRQKMPAK
ncbi:MAG: SDR family oxidoreductase [Chitinophagales bacterium]|nr:SDR family oxidoreductase [Chitinophagales bacterium]